MKKVIFSLKLSTGNEIVNVDVFEGEGLAIVGADSNRGTDIIKSIAQKSKNVIYRGISGGLQKSEQDLFDLEIGYVTVDKEFKRQKVADVIDKVSVFYDMLKGEVQSIIDLPNKYLPMSVGELPTFLQERLALLGTMSVGHSTILIDDVFGIDGTKDAIIEFLKKAGKKPLTYIVATSDLNFASICSKSLIVDDGRVVEWGKTAKVLKTPVHPYSRWFVELSRRGKTTVSWRKNNGKLKKRACKYALTCPDAGDRCMREYSPFLPYTQSEYTSCYLAELKANK